MSWGLYRTIWVPPTLEPNPHTDRQLTQHAYGVLETEKSSPYRDPHRIYAIDCLLEVLRTCYIPDTSAIRIEASGHWSSRPAQPNLSQSAPFSFRLDVKELLP